MKNLRNLMAWISLVVVLAMGTVSANANGGVVLADRNSCTSDTGMLDYVAVILANVTGVVLADRGGVVLADRGGVVLADRCVEQNRTGVVLAD